MAKERNALGELLGRTQRAFNGSDASFHHEIVSVITQRPMELDTGRLRRPELAHRRDGRRTSLMSPLAGRRMRWMFQLVSGLEAISEPRSPGAIPAETPG